MAIRPIAFSRLKYGAPLLADVAEVGALRGFIQTREPHEAPANQLAWGVAACRTNSAQGQGQPPQTIVHCETSNISFLSLTRP